MNHSSPDFTASLRHASRKVVRELGMLQDQVPGTDVSAPQAHTLLELAYHGALTSGELADILRTDKSTTSRALKKLQDQRWVEFSVDSRDRRRKPARLTRTGTKHVQHIHHAADTVVNHALALLPEDERNLVCQGMHTYAKALERSRLQREFDIRPIRREDDPEIAKLVRAVLEEFGGTGPGYAIHDAELDSMFRAYQPSRCKYWVVLRNGRVVGGAGFAPLDHGDEETCELRKMYFYPECRGVGLGARMVQMILEEAKKCGFTRCYLETLCRMDRAQRLYDRFGFRTLDAPLGNTGHHACDAWRVREL